MQKTASYYQAADQNLVHSLLEKHAVDISQLTRAYNKTVKPAVFRVSRGQAKANARLRKILTERGAPQELVSTFGQAQLAAAVPKRQVLQYKNPDLIRNIVGQATSPYLTKSEVRAAQESMVGQVNRMKVKGRGMIGMPGDQSRAFKYEAGVDVPKDLSGSAKNIINRATGLHEAAELKAFIQSATSRGKASGPTFASHIGPNPMLNDVNIANTLTGKGSEEAARVIMQMRRPELKMLRAQLNHDVRAKELIDRLLSGNRISRHGRRYLDRAYAGA